VEHEEIKLELHIGDKPTPTERDLLGGEEEKKESEKAESEDGEL
jgi:hypothetical protein